jgi:hypothetical protein
VKAAPLVDEVRDAPAQQRAPERFEVGEPAQQDGDVAAPDRPRSVVHAFGRARSEQRRDAARDLFGLGFDARALDFDQLRAAARAGRPERGERVVLAEGRIKRPSGRRKNP